MAEIVVAQRMWQRRGTPAEWAAANPVLESGEIGVEELGAGIVPKFKIGDGVTPWLSLGYAGSGSGSGGSIAPALHYNIDMASVVDGDPGAGNLRFNNASPGSATTVFLDNLTSDSVDIGALWGVLAPGGFMYVTHAVDATKWQLWQTTAVTEVTGYAKIGVSLIAQGPGAFATADAVLVVIQEGDTSSSNSGNIYSGAFVSRAANQSTADSTDVSVSFDTENSDVGGWYNPAQPTRLTVPAGVSRVQVFGGVMWASSGAGVRIMRLRKNGADVIGGFAEAADATAATAFAARQSSSSAVLDVVPGDYFELVVRQTSGAALNVTGSNDGTWLSIRAVEGTPISGSMGAVFDGGASVLQVGATCYVVVPYDCAITEMTVLASSSGSLGIDVRVGDYLTFPPTSADSIVASSPPSLVGAQKRKDTALAGWSKNLTKGQIVSFVVTSCSGITWATLNLGVNRK